MDTTTTDAPTSVPTSTPTSVPTAVPTSVPTPVPSISCPTAAPIYRLNLFDSGGDGWGTTSWYVYNATDYPNMAEADLKGNGTLTSGSSGTDWVCLADGCYELVVSPGTGQESVTFIDEIGGTFSDFDSAAGGGIADHFCVSAGDVFAHPTPAPSVSPVPTPETMPPTTAFPSPVPTMAPTVLPTAAPTPAPTRTPIVAVTISIDSITCADDFDATVLDDALDTILSGVSFTDAACTDTSTGISTDVEASATGDVWNTGSYTSLYDFVVGTCNAAVSDGSFDEAIAAAEARRRLQGVSRRDLGRRLAMSDGTVASVSVSTFSPTAAPTPAPSETPTPTPAPTPVPKKKDD